MQIEPRLWKHLPAELVGRIFSFFPPNELACTIRLVNKASAELFKDNLVVHLSQLSPNDAFAWKWSSRQATQNLALSQRRQLVYLTAQSGSVENLLVALTVASCRLCEGILDSAASAGHLHACQWLAAKDYPISCRAVTLAAKADHVDVVRWLLQRLTAASPGSIDKHAEQAWVAAAEAGRQNVCEGLQADGFAPGPEALFAAAWAGRVDLTDWLLQMPQLQRALTDQSVFAEFLRRAAYGYDLSALQRLFSSLQLSGRLQDCLLGAKSVSVAWGAVSSPTADWRAKTEWLEEQNLRLSEWSCDWYHVAKAPEPVERLTFIRERVADFAPELLIIAVVEAEAVSLLQFLQHDGFFGERSDWERSDWERSDWERSDWERSDWERSDWERSDWDMLPHGATWCHMVPHGASMDTAAELGNVALMEALRAVGIPITWEVYQSSVMSGHLHALEWLWAAGNGPAIIGFWGRTLVNHAAWTGKVELVEWLVARGCPLSEYVFDKAAQAGSPLLLEWLAARGCPMGELGTPYVSAGRNGDMITLECLRRLNCPWWGEPGLAFFFAVGGDRMDDTDAGGACSLEVLRWLHAQGCPVDWALAGVAAEGRTDSEAGQVQEWVRSQRLLDEAAG